MDNMKQLKPLEPSSLRTLCGYLEQIEMSDNLSSGEILMLVGSPLPTDNDQLLTEIYMTAAERGLSEDDGLGNTRKALELARALPLGSLKEKTRDELELMLK